MPMIDAEGACSTYPSRPRRRTDADAVEFTGSTLKVGAAGMKASRSVSRHPATTAAGHGKSNVPPAPIRWSGLGADVAFFFLKSRGDLGRPNIAKTHWVRPVEGACRQAGGPTRLTRLSGKSSSANTACH